MPRVPLRAFLLTALLFSAAPALCGERILVEGGATDYEIVRGDDAGTIVRTAAGELQHFIEKSTGVRLAVVGSPTPDKGHIFVGANPASTAAGITPDGLKSEGFRIKTVGRDIHIVGVDVLRGSMKINSSSATQCGTLSGVYEFLERCLGVMFCRHDELGTAVPKHERIIVPDMDVTDTPDWSYRVLAYGPADGARQLYGRRLRLGHPYTVSHSHAWFRILPIKEYGADHPEYYAEIKGERAPKYYLGHHGGQVCTTNPEVIRLFAQAAKEYFDEHPDRDMFSVSPNDGGGFCRCARCRALDVEMLDDMPDMPVLTDRLLTFYNAIAVRLAKSHPGKWLGAYIYSYYKKPPRKVRPHPNLALVHATNSARCQGAGWPEEHEWEKQWLALTKRCYKYDIYYYGRTSLHLMAPVTTHLIEKLKAEQEIGFMGGYLYIGQSYEQLGAGHYLLAKLMWDKDADARALERQYYNALYGAAGPDVLAYYHLLEDRLRKMYLDGVDVDEPAVKAAMRGTTGISTPGRLLAAYWPILDRATDIIEKARSRNLSEPERKRLARLIDHHELLVSTVRGMIAAGRLEEQAEFKAADAAMLREAVERRERVRARLAEYAPTLTEYLKRAESGDLGRLSPDGAFYRLAKGWKKPVLVAVRAEKAPAIDGLGDDAAWRKAPPAYLLLTRSGSPPKLGARAMLAFDDENLYVFVEGRENDTARLLKKETARDSTRLFDEDNVEFFIQPPGGIAYYHLGLGAGGALYDAAHPTGEAKEYDVGWDSHAKAAVNITDTSWSAEMAVPFASLGAKPTAAGEWHANVCRTRRGDADPDEYTAAAPTLGGYHKPKKFAQLSLVETVEITRFRDGTFDDVPPAEAAKRLRAAELDGAIVEVTADGAYCGRGCVHIKVPKGGLAAVTLEARVKAGTGYRALFAHRNEVVSLAPGIRPCAPITRVIFRDDGGKSVTPTEGYSWDGPAAEERPGEWRTSAHVFTTPPKTTRISFTMFFKHPGEYRLDEVRLDLMGTAKE